MSVYSGCRLGFAVIFPKLQWQMGAPAVFVEQCDCQNDMCKKHKRAAVFLIWAKAFLLTSNHRTCLVTLLSVLALPRAIFKCWGAGSHVLSCPAGLGWVSHGGVTLFCCHVRTWQIPWAFCILEIPLESSGLEILIMCNNLSMVLKICIPHFLYIKFLLNALW